MVVVGCPGCRRAIPLPPSELSWTIECSQCGRQFVPVPSTVGVAPGGGESRPGDHVAVLPGNGAGPSDREVASSVRGLFWHRLKLRLRILVFLAFVLAAFAGGVACIYVATSGSFSGPATCKEVAERLQWRGMRIRWMNCGFKHPAIYIVKEANTLNALEIDVFRGDGMLANAEAVMVIQFPTTAEAVEKAGTMKHAFSSGRFMFYGDPELVDAIRGRL
jgi:hypothetical protein